MMLPDSIDTFARTLWGEARGTGLAGMSHVADVIMNRMDHPRWWGRDIISVCRAPYQFSCWNQNDPNYPKLLTVTESDPTFSIAVTVAMKAAYRKLVDVTDGADSYYAISLHQPPYWAKRATRTYSDGWHVFLRVELAAPSGERDPDAPPISIHHPICAHPTSGEDEADMLDNKYNNSPPDEADLLDDQYDREKQ